MKFNSSQLVSATNPLKLPAAEGKKYQTDSVIELDLLCSQEIKLDYILELILDNTKQVNIKAALVDEVRRAIRASLGNRAKEGLLVDFINPAVQIQSVMSSPQQTAAPEIRPPAFQCDGRKHCSQMSSCSEAKQFLNNCPGMEMDGDGDRIPCEHQVVHGVCWRVTAA